MKKKIILLILIFSLSISFQAQTKFKNLTDKKGLEFLNNLNLNIISLVPTKKEYESFNEKIHNKIIPAEYIKYIDSIDYSKFNNKLSFIKIYSQNRSYRSQNSYEVKKMKRKDSLSLTNIHLDMKIKDYIIDYKEYQNQKIEYEIIEKKLKDRKIQHRIVFFKTIN
ncbi:hypothetical protein APS56_15660 [Pseudalgibacter alginicilyticus]|uniref:Uncharacterized protein n=1 Tax=Pseudalgibacter alginicilyticus TaxID=1736674 RepID=A0A0P0D8M6_9FLAO|nr:hypothetical protein [Pseudalgibacter alginicilyticus]ALJ06482.1 hypothetical protein APS56_15660 [Pseudalgibacter alginicilyticus]